MVFNSVTGNLANYPRSHVIQGFTGIRIKSDMWNGTTMNGVRKNFYSVLKKSGDKMGAWEIREP